MSAGSAQALAKSGLPREEVYITTKLWNSDQGYDSTLKAFDRSMEKLGIALSGSLSDPLAVACEEHVRGHVQGVLPAA